MSIVDVTILNSGDLKISADRNDLYLMDSIEDSFFDKSEVAALCEILESYMCNGSYTPFDASEGNPFVGLTSAPCIAEEMDYSDNGDMEIVGRYWYFPNYMIESPIETLIETGEVIFTLAR